MSRTRLDKLLLSHRHLFQFSFCRLLFYHFLLTLCQLVAVDQFVIHTVLYILVSDQFIHLGPFVMCTDEEIKQALNDYRQGENGFEKAHTWNSWVAYE